MSDATLRDPLTDPAPGDWIGGEGPTGCRNEIRIDFVDRPDEVAFARFVDRGEGLRVEGLYRTARATYLVEAARGYVIWRAEDGDRPSPRPDDEAVPHGQA